MLVQSVIYMFYNLITNLNEVDEYVNYIESIYIHGKQA